MTFSITGVSSPFGVAIDKSTGEIWATNTGGNQLLRYPKFQHVIDNPMPDADIGVAAPIAVSLDPFGNPVVGEGINRVSFYFPGHRLHHFGRWCAGRLSGTRRITSEFRARHAGQYLCLSRFSILATRRRTLTVCRSLAHSDYA